jgi:hypothetical protein
MRNLKKYAMLLTILVGTSLAVYAAVIVPQMRNLSVSDITSTTARIHLKCRNTDYLLLYGRLNESDPWYLFDNLMVEHGDSGAEVTCEFSIGNMQPDTPYYIKIEAIGFEDPETGDRAGVREEIFLRTAIE